MVVETRKTVISIHDQVGVDISKVKTEILVCDQVVDTSNDKNYSLWPKGGEHKQCYRF